MLVYHYRDADGSQGLMRCRRDDEVLTEAVRAWAAGQYVQTARIAPRMLDREAGDVLVALGQGYRLTQHIDHAWWDRPHVNRLTAEEVRSTSTGDILEYDGRRFVVLPVGFAAMDGGPI